MKQNPGSLTLFAARLVLFWERAWPALIPILAPVTILAAISLFDFWKHIPVWAHWGLLGLGLAATIAAIIRFGHEMRWPTHLDGLRRLEADGKLAHTPLQTLTDVPFDRSQAPASDTSQQQNTLWQAHLKRTQESARGAKLKGAHATADHRDPFALRFSLIGLLILGVIAAGDNPWRRFATTFSPGASRETLASRADIWIDAPAYTGVAPVYLIRGGEKLPDLGDQLNVPSGSTLLAQINGTRGVSLSFIDTEGTRENAKALNDEEEQSSTTSRLTLKLTKPGLIQLQLGANRGKWPLYVVDDTPPIVEFVNPPDVNKNRAIRLHYQFEDDYGAAEAHLHFRLNPDQARPLDAPEFQEEALTAVREIALNDASGPSGERQHTLPVESDPWAGLEVFAKIVITDGAGQTGETEEVALTLPARPFFNPLAKAVIEQRQTLAVANQEIQRVRDAFNGITIIPEEFYEDTSEYLLLRTAFWRVQNENDNQHTDTVEHFWPLALELEDKALELARRRLEAAFEALRQALEENAPQERINELRADLQQAIDDYLQALAQAGVPEDSGGGGAEQIGTNTIEEMLDAIEDLSESGANNAARQMLGDLESLMENLRLSQGGSGSGGVPNPNADGSEGEGNTPEERAGELIGRQRDLSNRSFEQGQQPGANGDDLAQEQGDIAGTLQDLLDQLDNTSGNQPQDGSGGTPDPDGKAGQAFGEALREMQRAENALNAENFGAAGTAMDRAIAKLREGAQALAEEQARQAQADENGEQEGGGDGENGLDPLGRPTGGTASGNVDVPDGADPALTRDLIEKMRRRLGEQGRSEEEIDYLERLLEAF